MADADADAREAAPLLDAQALRSCGRSVPQRFQLALPTALLDRVVGPLQCEQILRCLPARRLVFLARAQDGRQMVAKLHLRRAARAMQSERTGLACLRDAAFAVPQLLAEAMLGEDAGLQLTEYIERAETLATHWSAATVAQRSQCFAVLAAGFARMHDAGAHHADPHLGNFLQADQVYAIDGGAVRSSGRALTQVQRLAALASLHGQCPPQDDLLLDVTIAAYFAAGGPLLQRAALQREVNRVRAKHVRTVLRKTLRDCSEFDVQHTQNLFVVCRRELLPSMQQLIASADEGIARGELLKSGNSATLARVVDRAGVSRVVKRYNMKSVWHRVSRWFRRSRAERTWLAAYRLSLLGLRTAQPLAMRLESIGPLRGRAYLWMEDIHGGTLAACLQAGAGLDSGLRERVVRVIARMHAAGLVHGDLKASNLLITESDVVLIDLDALVALPPGARLDRRQARERARFLENFAPGPQRDTWRAALLEACAGARLAQSPEASQ